MLSNKSLINISLDGKVTSHPLIERMGKELVRQESPNDPGRRSRLWSHEDIVQVLTNNMVRFRTGSYFISNLYRSLFTLIYTRDTIVSSFIITKSSCVCLHDVLIFYFFLF
jgi:hypothetical protein